MKRRGKAGFWRNALLFFVLVWGQLALAASTSCLELFRNVVSNRSTVNYQLNYDRAMARIKSLPDRFHNQLTVKKAFSYDGEDIYRVDMPSWSKPPLGRIIISAGVHGNESVTTATAVELLEELVYNSEIRRLYDIVVYPNMNPGGLIDNTRALRNGSDFNRTFRPGKDEKLTRLFKKSLEGEKFDLALDLHEAYKKDGFFIIKAQDDDKDYVASVLADLDAGYMFRSPTGEYPYNVPMIKNPKKTSYILESEGVTTSTNVGTVKTFYKTDLGARASYTLESSGQIELADRVRFYKQLVMGFINKF